MANINIPVSDNIHTAFKSEIIKWGRTAQIKTVIPFLMDFVSNNPEMFQRAFEEWIAKDSQLVA